MNTPNTEATTTEKAAAVAEQGATGAPEKPASKKDATKKKGAPKGQKAAKGGKTKADKPKKRPNEKVTSKKGAKAKEAAVPREFSKKSIVLDLLRRPKGATIAEIDESLIKTLTGGDLITATARQRRNTPPPCASTG